MYIQSQSFNHDLLTVDDSKMQKQSLSTNFFIYQNNEQINVTKEQGQISYKFNQGSPNTKIISQRIDSSFGIQQQLDQLCNRFSKIKNIFIQHSEHELSLHQKRLNLKSMVIDWEHIQPDVNNKIIILQNLEDYVDHLQNQGIQNEENAKSTLENKFQEYYLERHYGSLKCQFHELNINEKEQDYQNQYSAAEIQLQKTIEENKIDQNTKSSNQQHRSSLNLHSSKSNLQIDIYAKQNTLLTFQNTHKNQKCQDILIDDSKQYYQNELSQSFRHYDLHYDVPSIIQVQIPIIIYKTKEIIHQEELEKVQFSELDDIINKFTQPYQQIYLNAKQQNYQYPSSNQRLTKPNQSIIQNEKETNQFLHNQIASIMLNSNINKGIKKRNSQNQYYQSDSIDQNDVKLQLNSNLKGQFLNKENEQIGCRQAYQQGLTDRSIKWSSKISITQKIDNKQQIIQKFQESQRFLINENNDLSQKLEHYKAKLLIQQNKTRQLQQLAKQLTSKLQEQLQYVEKLTEKLEYLNIQVYEQKIMTLKNQLYIKEEKEEQFQSKLNQYEEQLKQSKLKENQLKIQIELTKKQLKMKQQELQQIIKMCCQKEEQLKYYQDSQLSILEEINYKKEQLLQQISIKQQQNFILKEKLKEYQNLMQQEGIVIKYEDLEQIKLNLEHKQLTLNKQIQQKQYLQKLFINQTTSFQSTLQQIQQQLMIEKQTNLDKSRQIQRLQQKNKVLNEQLTHNNIDHIEKIEKINLKIKAIKKQNEQNLKQFQAILNQYDIQLLQKNQQIIKMKQKLLYQETKWRKQQQTIILRQQNEHHIQSSSKQLQMQRGISLKDQKVKLQVLESRYKQLYNVVVRDYQKLKKQKLTESTLRQKHDEYLLNQISKLKKINLRLKRYTTTLQQDLICVNTLDKCQYHQMLIKHLVQQKDYYLQFLSGHPNHNKQQ